MGYHQTQCGRVVLPRRRGRAALTLVLAVVTAGCGANGAKSAGGTTLPAVGSHPTTSMAPTASSTASSPPTTNAALAAQARAGVFQTADFPVSFKAQADQAGDCPASDNTCGSLSLETIWHDITVCLGVDDSPPIAVATSPTYKQGLATQARSTVEYTTASSADTIAAALAGPKFPGCATDAFNADAKRNAPPGATPGPSSVSPLPAPQVGQKVSATRVNVTMHLSDLPIMIFQDFVVVFNGRTVTRLYFLNPGSPFPPELEQSLVQNVVTRAGT